MRFLTTVLLAFLSSSVLSDSAGIIKKGMDTSKDYLSTYGNQDSFNELIVNPMLGEGSLQTTNREKSFKAPMICGSDIEFLQLTLGIMPHGEIQLAKISVDSDLDGEFEQNVVGLPHVSGTCSNGYISCNTNSWNNCKYYVWDTTESGGIQALESSILGVGSCKCINNSCSPNWSTLNFDTIQFEIGAIVSQTLAKHDYSLTTTKVSSIGPTISYYGQAISQCGGADVTGTSFYNNDNAMGGAVSTALESDSLESRIYNIAKKSESAAEAIGSVSFETCNIVRESDLDEVSLFDIISIGAGTASANLINANTVDITVGRIGDNYFDPPGSCGTFEQHAKLAIFRPDRILSAELKHVKYDDHMQVILNNILAWNGPHGDWTNLEGNPISGTCERKTNQDFTTLSVNLMHLFPANPDTLNAKIRVRVGGQGEGYARIRVKVDTDCQEAEDAIINSCQGYEQSPSCKLKEEKVDGIQTVSNFSRTGRVVPPLHSVLSSPTCEIHITRDWMGIERTYECDKETSFDLSGAATRVHTIESTTTEAGYKDLRSDQPGSEPVNLEGSLVLFDEIPVERCTLQCKVTNERSANDVTVFGLTSEELDNNRRTDVFYRSCEEGICPLESGEEIIQDCACINGLSDVAIMMQLIRMAGSDMICSSGQKQQL